jgi:hypothetical protein
MRVLQREVLNGVKNCIGQPLLFLTPRCTSDCIVESLQREVLNGAKNCIGQPLLFLTPRCTSDCIVESSVTF